MTDQESRRRVLVVDDDDGNLEVLQAYLSSEGFDLTYASRGEKALTLAKAGGFELVLLDLNLPDISGIEVFRILRRYSQVPVIMVTSRGAEIDRVVGLELGADDYVSKPFSPRELVARIKSVLRRSSGAQTVVPPPPASPDNDMRCFEDLEIHLRGYEAKRNGKPLHLTPTEFRILETLSRHPGQVFTRTQLLDLVSQDHGEIYDRTLDRHIANIRRKLEDNVSKPYFIRTVVGIGYKFLG